MIFSIDFAPTGERSKRAAVPQFHGWTPGYFIQEDDSPLYASLRASTRRACSKVRRSFGADWNGRRPFTAANAIFALKAGV
jgi:hypothetical protein